MSSSGSHATPRWKEQESNSRSPGCGLGASGRARRDPRRQREVGKEHAIEQGKILRACQREHVVARSKRRGRRSAASDPVPNHHQTLAAGGSGSALPLDSLPPCSRRQAGRGDRCPDGRPAGAAARPYRTSARPSRPSNLGGSAILMERRLGLMLPRSRVAIVPLRRLGRCRLGPPMRMTVSSKPNSLCELDAVGGAQCTSCSSPYLRNRTHPIAPAAARQNVVTPPVSARQSASPPRLPPRTR
jgi:hypothetical protein